MTSEAINGTTNAGLLAAVIMWQKSVELVQILIDRSLNQCPPTLSLSDHDDFSAALRALYALEAAIFPMEPMELPKPAISSWSCAV